MFFCNPNQSGAEEWKKVTTDGTSSTYSLTAMAAHNGYLYRCVVKNEAGSVTSSVAALYVAFDPYNLGDETYSFENYSESDPDGHCFGMSMTSAGYHLGLLDIGIIGGNANSKLYINRCRRMFLLK